MVAIPQGHMEFPTTVCESIFTLGIKLPSVRSLLDLHLLVSVYPIVRVIDVSLRTLGFISLSLDSPSIYIL